MLLFNFNEARLPDSGAAPSSLNVDNSAWRLLILFWALCNALKDLSSSSLDFFSWSRNSVRIEEN